MYTYIILFDYILCFQVGILFVHCLEPWMPKACLGERFLFPKSLVRSTVSIQTRHHPHPYLSNTQVGCKKRRQQERLERAGMAINPTVVVGLQQMFFSPYCLHQWKFCPKTGNYNHPHRQPCINQLGCH